jgi:hypothetical protein
LVEARGWVDSVAGLVAASVVRTAVDSLADPVVVSDELEDPQALKPTASEKMETSTRFRSFMLTS